MTAGFTTEQATALNDLCDVFMEEYEESDENIAIQEEISGLYRQLMDALTDDSQKDMLISLMDKVNNDDSGKIYLAFRWGVKVCGLTYDRDV